MTYLQIVNSVLKRLRENEVSSVNDTTYSKLIGELVNETKREVEDAWNWNRLRETILVTCVSGVFSYTLTGSGERFKILQVINDSQDVEMRRYPYKAMNRLYLYTDSPEYGNPEFYDLNGYSGAGDVNIDVWPIPNSTDVLNFNMIIPQEDLSSDTMSVIVPSWPIVLGAYAKAVSERGEDGSMMYAEALNAYNSALSDAIAIDAHSLSEELEWRVC